MTDDHALLLGEIKGKLDLMLGKQDKLESKVNSVDTRLQKVETRSAAIGGGAGALVSVGVAILIEKGKRTIGL